MKKFYFYILLLLAATTFAQISDNYELSKIEFSGNQALSSSQLSSIILSKESPNWFSQFLDKFTSYGDKASYLDTLLLTNDIAAIKSLYHSNGYFKIKVTSRVELDHESKTGAIYFNIDESQPAYFNSFIIDGLDSIPGEYKDRINEYAKIDTDMIYRDAVVEDKKNFAITFLRDHGFMLAKYDLPDVFVDTVQNKVDVKINFESGKRYRISEIRTARTGEGLDLVDDQLIKDIVGIKPEQWYSYYDIQKGQVRLYRTELFNSAVINSVISDTSGNRVPLNISADVGLLHELSPEIIANNEYQTFNLGLGLSFINKNFFGNARKFTISTSAAVQNINEFIKQFSFESSSIYGYGDLRAIIQQPFLFGKQINTQFETYLTAQKRKDEYNSNLYGAKLSLDFDLPQFTYFSSFSTYLNVERANYTFKEPYLINLLSTYYQRKENISADSSFSKANVFVKDTLGGSLTSVSTNALLGLIVATNKTNDLFFPNSGYTLSLIVEDANSIPYLLSKAIKQEFSSPLYFKSTFTASTYLPFYSSAKNAFALKLKFGQILTYRGEKANIPLNQRLYSGGSTSLRGWGTRELVPPNELISLVDPTAEDIEAILQKGAPTGGFFLVEGSIETRNRIIGNFGSALFLDYGNTWNSPKEFRFGQIAVSTGFGLRYYSDFAPFRIDIGIKLYDPNDRRSTFKKKFLSEVMQIHIGIGEAF